MANTVYSSRITEWSFKRNDGSATQSSSKLKNICLRKT